MTDKTKHPLKKFFVFSDLQPCVTVVAASYGFTENGVHFRDESGVFTASFPSGTTVMSDDAQRVLDAPAPAVTELACGEAFAVDIPPRIAIGTINITGVTPENAESILKSIQALVDVRHSAGMA